MKRIRTKAPGKLYVAGEYAVVEPGYSAIITAVDLFIHLEVLASERNQGSIYSDGFTTAPISWHRKADKVQLTHPTPTLNYILSAIHTVEAYIHELGIDLQMFDLKVTSELDSQTGRKLGLGSSGAITVATVDALLQFYNVEPSNLLIYKLSVLAQLQLGVNSSFGDLAAIAYTGWIRYTSFDRESILKFLKKQTIKEVVEMTWPALEIKRLKVADDVHFLIGWTGSPASSDDLVGNVQENKQQSQKEYHHFLEVSKASVDILTTALQKNDAQQIKVAIERNRQALLEMGQQTNVLIETPTLTKLCEIAAEFSGVAKTSGAGGGDSGIAFVFNHENINSLIASWEEAGITTLPLSIYSKN